MIDPDGSPPIKDIKEIVIRWCNYDKLRKCWTMNFIYRHKDHYAPITQTVCVDEEAFLEEYDDG